jgi:hypothetical protein
MTCAAPSVTEAAITPSASRIRSGRIRSSHQYCSTSPSFAICSPTPSALSRSP